MDTTTTPAAQASAQVTRATCAYDELTYARVEALLTINLIASEIRPDPLTPGFSYKLSSESGEMLDHVAHLCLASIESAMKAMEEPAATHDPMLDLATAYKAANVALNESDITDDKEVDEYCTAHIDPLRDRIIEGTPTPTSMAGLLAALRLAEDCLGPGDPDLVEPLVRSAVRFLEGRAA